MKCIFSVDVEDWFHILDMPSSPQIAEWDVLPSRVEKSLMRLLDIFSEKKVHVTCFFLGWVAEKFPRLVLEASSRGHEIASHGYSHRLIYEMTQDEFSRDAKKSKDVLEGMIGRAVIGYRSPGFSATAAAPWFFEKVIEAGYLYDSSVFPARRGHGGLQPSNCAPHWVARNCGRLLEFPITVTRVLGKPMCFFGGGYLRVSPYCVIKRMASKVLKEGRPVIFYIHPREIDPGHPRLPMNLGRRFKSYVNLRSTHGKVSRILDELEVTTFEQFIAENGHLIQAL
jgi:polysaccharide deacetylase family protein (PEP-CTERM system associated)